MVQRARDRAGNEGEVVFTTESMTQFIVELGPDAEKNSAPSVPTESVEIFEGPPNAAAVLGGQSIGPGSTDAVLGGN